MSSFAGVTVLDGNDRCHCKVSGVYASAGVDTGYHLLIVEGHSRITELVPTGESVTCGHFVIGGHDWLLDYYPNGENPSCADYISVYLTRLYEADEEPVYAKFSFSLINQVEKQMPVYIRGTKTYSFSSSVPMWGISKFVRRDALEQSMDMICDWFTIRCDIMVCKDPKTKDDSGGTLSLPDIHQHFSKLLDDKLGADVAFEVGGETFAAHRCVLASRSIVFRAQLFGPMKEGTATSSIIQIKDMEAKVFKALLSFVYTDSFPEMYKDIMEEKHMIDYEEQEQADEAVDDEMSEAVEPGQEEEAVEHEMGLQWLQDLLVAADRYDLQRLKFICEKRISERIGVSSVASTLALAEKHHCHGLKEACLEFIQVQSPSRLKRVMATSGWEHLITTYPSVLNEFIAKLIASKRK